MINRSLDEEGFKKDQYQIIGIPDVFDCERWTKSIMKKVEFDVVFTMNAWVKQCFDLFGILVEKHPMYRKFSATQIRRMMDENEEWKSLVPKGSYEIINRINAKRRLVEQA